LCGKQLLNHTKQDVGVEGALVSFIQDHYLQAGEGAGAAVGLPTSRVRSTAGGVWLWRIYDGCQAL